MARDQEDSLMFIVYDPSQPYPQVPRPGEGIIKNGIHFPPAGMAAFEFDAQGQKNDDIIRDYRVTSAGVLERRIQADIDKAVAKEARQKKVAEANREAERRRVVASGGDPGEDELTRLRREVSRLAAAAGKTRREAKGRPNPGEEAELDALEALADSLAAIDTALALILAEIDVSADPASIDIRNHPSWP